MKQFVTDDMKRFNYLSSELDAAYHDAAVKMGLSDSAMLVLYAICGDGGDSCLLSDIPRLSGVSKQTINSALRKLETEGVVYLEVPGGRRKRVRLTEAGKALAGRTVLPMIEIENQIFDGWPREERELYLDLTLRYLTEFKEKTKDLYT